MIAEDINGVGWPKPDAVGEKLDVSEMKPEVAQVHRRLNLQFASIDKQEPAK